jgi:hypothetical protein
VTKPKKRKAPERLYVQIRNDATLACHQQMGPFTRRQAGSCRDGANINLNHCEWTVWISKTKTKVVK